MPGLGSGAGRRKEAFRPASVLRWKAAARCRAQVFGNERFSRYQPMPLSPRVNRPAYSNRATPRFPLDRSFFASCREWHANRPPVVLALMSLSPRRHAGSSDDFVIAAIANSNVTNLCSDENYRTGPESSGFLRHRGVYEAACWIITSTVPGKLGNGKIRW